MKVRLNLEGERIGPKFVRVSQKNKKLVNAAARGAAQDVVDYVVPIARQNITQAGKFGSRWTNGFQGKVTEGGGNIKVTFIEKVPYWRVFEFGAVIHGRPLLWIPLSFATDAQGVKARDYPGKLFRVDRKHGAPLLMAPGKPAQPKYFGKTSVRIPKKFHLRDIIRDGAKKLKLFYSERVKSEKSNG